MSEMAKARRFRCTAAALAVLWSASCADRLPEPVEISLNEDTCSQCRMALSGRRFAAEAVSSGGHVEFFDDIGCLARWVARRRPPASTGLFVMDYRETGWLRAEEAAYVVSKRLPTPMSYGIAAFESRSAAHDLATETGGSITSWEGIREGTGK